MNTQTVTARSPLIDFSQTPRFWNDNSCAKSHVYDAFSAQLPIGEQMFIDAARQVVETHFMGERREYWNEMIKGFVAQEAIHRRVHQQWNDILRARGYPIDQIEAITKRNTERGMSRTPLEALAGVVAAEHFTAIMGKAVLSYNLLQNAEHDIKTKWEWHSLEEIEHKSIVHDLYVEAGGSKTVLNIALAFVSFELVFSVTKYALSMAKVDQLMWHGSTWRDLYAVLWGKQGMFRLIFRDWRKFFKKDFHPNQIDSTDLAKNWASIHTERFREVKRFEYQHAG